MKKTIFLIAMATFLIGVISTVSAQEDNDRSARRQEMQTRQIERLVKDMNLEGETKTQFESVYKRYLEELAATRTQQTRNRESDRNKKDISEEEATAKLNEIFTRQAEQIQQQQLRLDIQKKYCAELSSLLSPQQLLKVFQQSQNGRPGNRQGGFQQGGRGGFGGGGPRGGFGGGGFGGPDGF